MTDSVEVILLGYINLFGPEGSWYESSWAATPPPPGAARTAMQIAADTLDSHSATAYRATAARLAAAAVALPGIDDDTIRLVMENEDYTKAVQSDLRGTLNDYRMRKAALGTLGLTGAGTAGVAAFGRQAVDEATSKVQAAAQWVQTHAAELQGKATEYKQAQIAQLSATGDRTGPDIKQGPYVTGDGKAPKEFYDAMNTALDHFGVTDAGERENWVRGYETLVSRTSGFNPSAVTPIDSLPYYPWVAEEPRTLSDESVVDYGLANLSRDDFDKYRLWTTGNNINDPVASLAASMNYVMATRGVDHSGRNLVHAVPLADPDSMSFGTHY